jgi:hypothetical protein
MVKVALKDIDFQAVRRIAYIAAVAAPLAILGACGQQSGTGDVSGTANKEATPPAAAPEQGQEATPPAEQPAAPAEGQSSSGGEAAPAPAPAPDSGSSGTQQ